MSFCAAILVFIRRESKKSCAESFNPLEKIMHRHAKMSAENVTASHFLAKRALIRAK